MKKWKNWIMAALAVLAVVMLILFINANNGRIESEKKFDGLAASGQEDVVSRLEKEVSEAREEAEKTAAMLENSEKERAGLAEELEQTRADKAALEARIGEMTEKIQGLAKTIGIDVGDGEPENTETAEETAENPETTEGTAENTAEEIPETEKPAE